MSIFQGGAGPIFTQLIFKTHSTVLHCCKNIIVIAPNRTTVKISWSVKHVGDGIHQYVVFKKNNFGPYTYFCTHYGYQYTGILLNLREFLQTDRVGSPGLSRSLDFGFLDFAKIGRQLQRNVQIQKLTLSFKQTVQKLPSDG